MVDQPTCENCGAEIGPDQKFCNNCGAEQPQTPPDQSSQGPPNQQSQGPPNQQSQGPPNQQSQGPPNRRPQNPPNQQSQGPPNQQPQGPPNQRPQNPPNQQPQRPPNQQPQGPPNQQPPQQEDGSDGLIKGAVKNQVQKEKEQFEAAGQNAVTIHFRDDAEPIECKRVSYISYGRLVRVDFNTSEEHEYQTLRHVYPIDRIKYIEGPRDKVQQTTEGFLGQNSRHAVVDHRNGE